MNAILIVNMGGPLSEEDMKIFLLKMFNDKRIIGMPGIIRKIIARKITTKRYKKSWEKYQMINGTPIIENTKITAKEIEKQLSGKYLVDYAFSYSNPLIAEAMKKLAEKGAKNIRVVPLYPQASYTTTGSVSDDIEKVSRKLKNIKITMSGDFSGNENFISFWEKQIREHIKINNLENPLLIFSGHSIPMKVVKKGDTYGKSIENSAKLISAKLNLEYKVCYQSKIGKVKWLEPDTKELLLKITGYKQIVLVPISFVSENLETKYDLDTEIIPFIKEKCNFEHISRVQIPVVNNLLIKTYINLV